MAVELVCWNCGESIEDIPRPISRHANCRACYEVLHCCRMCRWYAPGRPQACDHDRAELIVEKEVANFCEYFSPRAGAWKAASDGRKAVAKSKLESLFGDGDDAGESPDGPGDVGGPDDNEAIHRKLDDLFGD